MVVKQKLPQKQSRVVCLSGINQADTCLSPCLNRHHKGCHCKKSNCLKKYCECFQVSQRDPESHPVSCMSQQILHAASCSPSPSPAPILVSTPSDRSRPLPLLSTGRRGRSARRSADARSA